MLLRGRKHKRLSAYDCGIYFGTNAMGFIGPFIIRIEEYV